MLFAQLGWIRQWFSRGETEHRHYTIIDLYRATKYPDGPYSLQESQLLLQTNQRSERAIVEVGNQLMQAYGLPGRWRMDKAGGSVQLYCLDQLKVKVYREDDPDLRFRPPSLPYDDGFMATRCLKFCWAMITQPEHQAKKIAVLSRTNQIYGVDLLEFKVTLLKQLDEAYEELIDVSTVHSYKGLEADLVVLTEVVEGVFPSFMPTPVFLFPFSPHRLILVRWPWPKSAGFSMSA
jgi:DNA helicase IV